MEAILVSVATSLAKGIVDQVSEKAVDAAFEPSTVAGLRFAIFGDLSTLEKELSELKKVLCRAQSIDPFQCDKNDLLLTWLRSINNAVIFADDVIDEIAYRRTRKQLKKRMLRLKKAVVLPKLLSLEPVFIPLKVSTFMSMTSEIYKEAEHKLKLAELMQKFPTPSALSENLRNIRENPSTSVVFGRQDDEEMIVRQLCSPDNGHDLHIVVIVARSGAGKTTLARKVFDNENVVESFGKRTWISVSDNFNLKRFLDEMIQSVIGERQNLDNTGAMEEKLQKHLQQEKRGYLLVLDDVWNTDEQIWKSVKSSLGRVMRSTRSRLLVTTQSSKVASVMRASLVHDLKDLGDDDAWRLFEEIALANKSQEQVSVLERIGRKILSRCSGLPLAIKTLGSLLGSMDTESEWQSVAESKIWQSSQSKIMPWLLLSFLHLPAETKMKQCFIHCSVAIKKGTYLLQSRLIQAWMAQGLVSTERIGKTYITDLVANGLLELDNQRDGCYLCMHDLVHDLAHFISKDECLNSGGTYDHLKYAAGILGTFHKARD